MTDEREFNGALSRSVQFTGRKQLLIAALALPTGLFLVSAQSLGIDPSAFEDTTSLVLAYGIGILFIIFSVWFLYTALLRNTKKGRYLVESLDHHPDRIVGITHVIHGATDRITVKYRERSAFSLAVRAEDVNAFIGHIASRAPHAAA